ncbi:MAG: hypothetical protein WC738_04225 [Candidatus Omnitrophota bacterium]|jgi:hypothetical protein
MGKGQKEFTNMLPERSPLGKKAVEFIEVNDEIRKLEEQRDKIKKELINEFLASGKNSIKVNGITVSYSHTESDKLMVRQEKKI